MGRWIAGFFFGALFLAVAVAALMLYGGTPHGGPTVSCGPVNYMGHIFTIQADCRYVSIAELGVAVLFIFMSLMSVLASRPRR